LAGNNVVKPHSINHGAFMGQINHVLYLRLKPSYRFVLNGQYGEHQTQTTRPFNS
jgi:hypothetical protein